LIVPKGWTIFSGNQFKGGRTAVRLPTFLLIGAARSGSTTLYEYLKQHPEIFMSSVKSPKYFAYDEKQPGLREWGLPGIDEEFKVRTADEYQRLFEEAKDELQIGEASIGYLESAYAPERIKRELGDVKILVILRNPVRRGYSGYRMQLRGGTTSQDIRDALKDPSRVHWIQVGFYHRLLKRYFDIFPHENIKVVIFEEFVKDKAGAMKEIYRFLGVDESFTPDTSMAYARGGIPRTGVLNTALRKVGKAVRSMMPEALQVRLLGKVRAKMNEFNVKQEPPLTQELYDQLKAIYREDIANLEKLLSREIPEWH
jgi:hypothetical protein